MEARKRIRRIRIIERIERQKEFASKLGLIVGVEHRREKGGVKHERS